MVLYGLVFLSMYRGTTHSRQLSCGCYGNASNASIDPLSRQQVVNDQPTRDSDPDVATPAQQHPPCSHGQVSGHHQAFLWYPFIYLTCTLPLAVLRLLSDFGMDASAVAYCVAGLLLASNGLWNALLWTATMLVSNPDAVHDAELDRFAFVRTPRARRHGNMIWIQGGRPESSRRARRRRAAFDHSRDGGGRWWWWRMGGEVREEGSNNNNKDMDMDMPDSGVCALSSMSPTTCHHRRCGGSGGGGVLSPLERNPTGFFPVHFHSAAGPSVPDDNAIHMEVLTTVVIENADDDVNRHQTGRDGFRDGSM